jgi:hypothetical protein
MATVLLYLSEVEEGGETVFKKEGEDGEWTPPKTTVKVCAASFGVLAGHVAARYRTQVAV